MVWYKRVIILLIAFFLFSCRKESKINCDEISINGLGIILDTLHVIPITCMLEVMYPDSLVLLKSKQINYRENRRGYPYIGLFFGVDAEKAFSSRAKYHIVLDDTLHFHIEDIKIKTDTAGMTGMGRWAIFCIVDSFTVNNARIASKFSDALYCPMSLGKVSRD